MRPFVLLLALSLLACRARAATGGFRAGAFEVDIAPTEFPVRVNAMFTERSASQVVDPLRAKALALDDGNQRLVLCVVDSCMVPQSIIDQAKAQASKATGIPVERMLVSATHTHSAPSAMGCLGSRVDPRYAAALPARLAEAMLGAVRQLQPARVGWTQFDTWQHTFNRRWIRRPDRLLEDPFGQRSVRAHMHPGYQSPDVTGPSGPVDPQVSVLALQTTEGRPLAVFANFSQHYYGSDLLSSDYYGRFARHLAQRLGADEHFVGIMSQGTSGDLMWMDYSAPARDIGYDAYAREIAERVAEAMRGIRWQDTASLRSATTKLALRYRVPDEARLSWARDLVAKLGDQLPKTLPEVYAGEAIHLHDRPETELTLQALRIGDVGIAAIPNEVFSLTGLKLKRQSPLPVTFNVELANGAEGYIPPPEQHRLGGYTTWPARTAGLEEQAEPRIVEALLGLLEEVAERPRRPVVDGVGAYSEAVLRAKPLAYWRLEDLQMPVARDATGQGRDARYEFAQGVALYLPGADARVGYQPPQPTVPNAFSGGAINRAAHFAGGRLVAKLDPAANYTVEFWLWNGLPTDARAVTGYLFSRGVEGDATAAGIHLGVGGTHRPDLPGKLFLFNGNERQDLRVGKTTLEPRRWYHVALVVAGESVRVHLQGQTEPEIAGTLPMTTPAAGSEWFLGGRNDRMFGWEGKLDEIAVYDRALRADEIAEHFRASGLPRGELATAGAMPDSGALSPTDSLARIHVPPGFKVELVAAEPLTMDPVAIDWDARGRLWVVEMADYPLGLDGAGRPGGRVRVLEDTDGDGRYDRSTLFADGLNFPNGLLVWRDGVIVTAAPEILFLRDTDGDGRADEREVLVSGLMEGNQQLRANGLRWGLDNWVYCASGGHHGNHGVGTRLKSRRAGTEVLVGSRDFRFRPDTGELEAESGPSQFGRNRDDWGRWYGTQNSRPLWQYVLPDRYLRRNPHFAAPDPTRPIVVPLNPKVWPASRQEKRFHSFNEAGHFTSACSGMIYVDDLLFAADPLAAPRWHAFTCEPFHNLVQHNVLTDDGVSFVAQRAPGEEAMDFFASEDRWCRPVMVRTGPDGALWVVDMYRYMIEHPDWLPAEGKAELLPNYRAGDDRGRIYRVFATERPPRPWPKLEEATPDRWVAALESPNGWVRDQAHQRILWRPTAAVVPRLEALAREGVDPRTRVQALSVLDGLGMLSPTAVVLALADESSGVRENALRLAERRPAPYIVAAATALVGDPDAKVRLQLAFTLGEWTEPAAGAALARLLVREAGDPFLRAAGLSSALPHLSAVSAAVVATGRDAWEGLGFPLLEIALGVGNDEVTAALLEPRLASGEGVAALTTAERFLDMLARRELRPEALRGARPVLGKVFTRLDALLAVARAQLDPDVTIPEGRREAMALAARDEAHRAEIVPRLVAWLDPRRDPGLRAAAVTALRNTGDDGVPARLLAAWSSASPATREMLLDAWLSREAWVVAFLQAAGRGELGAFSLDPTRRSRLARHPAARVREMLAALPDTRGTANRADVVARFRPALALTGDARRGAGVYARQCLQCHAREGRGNEVGPDLRSVVEHPAEKLLVNILDPSADVQPGYSPYHTRLTDGTEFDGLVVAETGTSLTLKLADGSTRVLRRADLAECRGANVSLMPEGLEAEWQAQDLADLIAFLHDPGKIPLPPDSPGASR